MAVFIHQPAGRAARGGADEPADGQPGRRVTFRVAVQPEDKDEDEAPAAPSSPDRLKK